MSTDSRAVSGPDTSVPAAEEFTPGLSFQDQGLTAQFSQPSSSPAATSRSGSVKPVSLQTAPSVVPILTIPWTSATAYGRMIALDLMPALRASKSRTMTIARTYSYFRFRSVRLRVVTNATTFNRGRVAVVWDPTYTVTTAEAGSSLRSAVLSYSHVILDASSAHAAEIEIPWSSVLTNFDTTQPASADTDNGMAGQIVLYNLEPLTGPANSAPSATIQVYAVFVDPEYGVSIPQHSLFPAAPALPGAPQTGQEDAIDAAAGDVKSLLRKTTSSLERVVDGAAEVAHGISDLWPFDQPLDSLSCFKAGRQLAPPCYSSGPTTGVRLSALPVAFRDNQSGPLGNAADMDLRTLAQKKSYIGEWDCASLSRFPVSPMVFVAPAGWDGRTDLSWLPYVSFPFTYWTGSIDYHLSFVCAAEVSGRFIATWVPNADIAVGAAIIPDMPLYPSVVLDISTSKNYVVSVPYVNTAPYLRVEANPLGNAALPALSWSSASANGQLVLSPATDLIFAAGAAPTISCWLAVSAGADFRLSVPRDITPPSENRFIAPALAVVSAPRPNPFDTQEDDDDDDAPAPTSTAPPAPPKSNSILSRLGRAAERGSPHAASGDPEAVNIDPSITSAPADRPFGEDHMTLKRILGRGCRSFGINDAIVNTGINLSVTPAISPWTDSMVAPQSLLDYFSRLYTHWEGDLIFRLLTDSAHDGEGTLLMRHLPSAYFSSAADPAALVLNDPPLFPSGWGAMDIKAKSASAGFEVAVPSYARTRLSRVVPIGTDTRNSSHGTLQLRLAVKQETTGYFLVSGGDSFMLHMPARVPSVLSAVLGRSHVEPTTPQLTNTLAIDAVVSRYTEQGEVVAAPTMRRFVPQGLPATSTPGTGHAGPTFYRPIFSLRKSPSGPGTPHVSTSLLVGAGVVGGGILAYGLYRAGRTLAQAGDAAAAIGAAAVTADDLLGDVAGFLRTLLSRGPASSSITDVALPMLTNVCALFVLVSALRTPAEVVAWLSLLGTALGAPPSASALLCVAAVCAKFAPAFGAPASGTPHSSPASMITIGIVGFVALAMGVMPASGDLATIVENANAKFSRIGKACTSLNATVSAYPKIEAMVEWCVSAVDDSSSTSTDELGRWIAAIHVLHMRKAEIPVCEDLRAKVFDLESTFQTMAAYASRPNTSPHRAAAFSRAAAVFTELREVARKARREASFAPEPFMVFLSGEPGTGKSTFAAHTLAPAVAAMEGLPLMEPYIMTPEIPHFDNYVGNPVFIIDELGASLSDSTRDDPYVLLNRLVSPTRAQVPMAHVDEKGLRFSSKMVVGVSNFDDSGHRIKDVASHMRRRQVWFKVNCSGRTLSDGDVGDAETQRFVPTRWVNKDLVVSPITHRGELYHEMNAETALEYILDRYSESMRFRYARAGQPRFEFGTLVDGAPQSDEEDVGESTPPVDAPSHGADDTLFTVAVNWADMTCLTLHMRRHGDLCFVTGKKGGVLIFRGSGTPEAVTIKLARAIAFHFGSSTHIFLEDTDRLDPDVSPADPTLIFLRQVHNFLEPTIPFEEFCAAVSSSDEPTRAQRFFRKAHRFLAPALRAASKASTRFGNWTQKVGLSVYPGGMGTLECAINLVTFSVAWYLARKFFAAIGFGSSVPAAEPAAKGEAHVTFSDDSPSGRARRAPKRFSRGFSGAPHAGNQQLAEIQPLIRKATYRIQTERGGVWGVLVAPGCLLTVGHVFAGLPSGSPVVVTSPDGVEKRMALDPFRVTSLTDGDGALWCAGNALPPGTSVGRHFATSAELTAYAAVLGPAHLLVPRANSTVAFSVSPRTVSSGLAEPIEYNVGGADHVVMNAFVYDAATAPGDCGAVLLVSEGGAAGRIVGMHVGSSNASSMSYSEMWSREMVENIVASQPQTTQLVNGHERGSPHVLAPGGTTPLEMPCKRVHMPTEAKIYPSPIFDIARPHVTEPAVLRPGDPRCLVFGSPLERGLQKFARDILPFPPEDLARIGAHQRRVYAQMDLPHFPRRALTNDEAAFGVPGHPHLHAMDGTAASGFPWNRRSATKAGLFSGPVSSDFFAAVDARWDLALLGQAKPSYFLATCKPERRALMKIQMGATRVIMVGDAELAVCMKRACGAFAAAQAATPLKRPSAVGIACESTHFHDAAVELIDFGSGTPEEPNKYIADIDYSDFDASTRTEMIDIFVDTVNSWYDDGPDMARLRRTLFYAVQHGHIIAHDTAYMDHTGNESGNWATTPLNCHTNESNCMGFWMKDRRARGLTDSLVEYVRCVKIFDYGDDLVMSVNRSRDPGFTVQGFIDAAAAYGFRLTPASKEGSAAFSDITGVQFLKRRFRRDHLLPGRWIAAIAQDTIWELTNWVTAKGSVSMLVDNLRTAGEFAAHHGDEFYDQFVAAVSRACHLKGIPYSAPARVEVLSAIYTFG